MVRRRRPDAPLNCLYHEDTFDEALNNLEDGADPAKARKLWDELIDGYEAFVGVPYPGPLSEQSEAYREERKERDRATAAGELEG